MNRSSHQEETGGLVKANDFYARLIAEHSTDSIVVTDREGLTVWCNLAFTKMSGFVMHEMQGKTPGSVLQGPATDPATVMSIRNALYERREIRTEIVNYSKSGSAYWIEIRITPIFDEEGVHTHFMSIERDVTERKDLQARLELAYRQLKQDLEAAGVVQEALLPRSSQIENVEFVGHHEPSHFVAGDTYDVLRCPSGRIGFFMIDVAGHGAAAALVSVAAHQVVAQAILQRENTEPLTETANKINGRWQSHLPFFTMVLGEIDPVSGTGTLVQAGHPCPVLLRSSGAVLSLGPGGLPVGVLPSPSYQETAFGFSPGDKLLIYSDGFTDTENAEGNAFSEQRLHGLLQDDARLPTAELMEDIIRELRVWQGSTKLQDDVTVLILEASSTLDESTGRRHDSPVDGEAA